MAKAASETPADRSERLLGEMANGVKSFSEDDLDRAIREHSEKLFHAHLEAVEAVGYRDAAQAEIDRVKARVDAEIRQKAEEKPTEPQIKAQVASDKRVQAAEDDYAWWKMMAAKWSGLLSSFESRRRMLQSYVQYLTQIAGDSGAERSNHRRLTARDADIVRRTNSG